MKKLSVLGLLCLSLCGCGVASNAIVLNDTQVFKNFVVDQDLASLDKITPFTLDRFMPLDDQHIAVIGVNKKSFLFTLSESCKNLRFAKKVSLASSVENAVQVNQAQISRIGEQYSPCTITGIYFMNQVQFDELAYLNHKVRNHGSNPFPRGM
jgi:hypothetical protein